MKNIRGQSLFEVILAIFIVTVVIVGVVSLSLNSISNAAYSRNRTIATKYTQELLEWLEKQKITDYDDFLTKISESQYYCFRTILNWNNKGACGPNEKIGTTIFIREASFVVETVNGKNLVTANVVTYWEDSKGSHEVRSVTYFGDGRDQ